MCVCFNSLFIRVTISNSYRTKGYKYTMERPQKRAFNTSLETRILVRPSSVGEGWGWKKNYSLYEEYMLSVFFNLKSRQKK